MRARPLAPPQTPPPHGPRHNAEPPRGGTGRALLGHFPVLCNQPRGQGELLPTRGRICLFALGFGRVVFPLAYTKGRLEASLDSSGDVITGGIGFAVFTEGGAIQLSGISAMAQGKDQSNSPPIATLGNSPRRNLQKKQGESEDQSTRPCLAEFCQKADASPRLGFRLCLWQQNSAGRANHKAPRKSVSPEGLRAENFSKSNPGRKMAPRRVLRKLPNKTRRPLQFPFFTKNPPRWCCWEPLQHRGSGNRSRQNYHHSPPHDAPGGKARSIRPSPPGPPVLGARRNITSHLFGLWARGTRKWRLWVAWEPRHGDASSPLTDKTRINGVRRRGDRLHRMTSRPAVGAEAGHFTHQVESLLKQFSRWRNRKAYGPNNHFFETVLGPEKRVSNTLGGPHRYLGGDYAAMWAAAPSAGLLPAGSRNSKTKGTRERETKLRLPGHFSRARAHRKQGTQEKGGPLGPGLLEFHTSQKGGNRSPRSRVPHKVRAAQVGGHGHDSR